MDFLTAYGEIKMIEHLTISDLARLALEFGLPCIVREREKEVTLIGETQLIIFKIDGREDTCQMQQIIG